jgi:Protein of unknown function (DUF1570)
MRSEEQRLRDRGITIGRRAWLAGALAGCLGTPAGAEDETDEEEIRTIEERALKAGLRPFRTKRSKHFLAVGNAPDDYLRILLIDCEMVALDYMEHYQDKGFKVAFPDERMIAIGLEDERAFSRFLRGLFRGQVSPAVVGVYHQESNWLVVQDYRHAPRTRRDLPVWADNLYLLAHEATHQLTFNTGLLNRHGDTPRCIGEGLAMYGEYRRPNVRMAPGQISTRRLHDLAHYQRGVGWYPVAKLLRDDGWWVAGDGAKLVLCYAESWLLVHYMIQDPTRLPTFRSYLEAISERKDADSRLDDARSHWGDLGQLDKDLKQYSIRLLNSG